MLAATPTGRQMFKFTAGLEFFYRQWIRGSQISCQPPFNI